MKSCFVTAKNYKAEPAALYLLQDQQAPRVPTRESRSQINPGCASSGLGLAIRVGVIRPPLALLGSPWLRSPQVLDVACGDK
jgi:hypothetical protein